MYPQPKQLKKGQHYNQMPHDNVPTTRANSNQPIFINLFNRNQTQDNFYKQQQGYRQEDQEDEENDECSIDKKMKRISLTHQFNSKINKNNNQYARYQQEQASQSDVGFEDYLHQVSEELSLKSIAIDKAIKMLSQVEEEKAALVDQLEKVFKQLQAAEYRIQELEKQLYSIKDPRIQDTYLYTPISKQNNKKSVSNSNACITKTIITDKTIPDQGHQQLKLISIQLFKQYAEKYDNILVDLIEWVKKQQNQLSDSMWNNKIQIYELESQELNQDKQPQKCQQIGQYVTSELLKQYQQLIQEYQSREVELQSMISELLGYIDNLEEKSILDNYQEKSWANPLSHQFVAVIAAEIKNKINFNDRNKNQIAMLKADNASLSQLLEQLINWIKKNIGAEKLDRFMSTRPTRKQSDSDYYRKSQPSFLSSRGRWSNTEFKWGKP